MPKKPQATERYTRPNEMPTAHSRRKTLRMSTPHESWWTRAADYVRDYDPMASHGTSLDNPVKKRRKR